MMAVAMAFPQKSPSADTFEEVAVKPKVLSSSPALSCISTVALSEVEVLEFSEDDDCGADEPSEAFQWCLVGSRIAPVFASLLDGDVLEDSPVHTLESDISRASSVTNAQGSAQWSHVGLRLAAVMKEAVEQNDVEEELHSGVHVHRSDLSRVGTDAEEKSWRLVGLRLALLFSSLDCDGEVALPTRSADEPATAHNVVVAAVASGGVRESPKEGSLEAHERWHTVGSRLSAVLRTAEQ